MLIFSFMSAAKKKKTVNTTRSLIKKYKIHIQSYIKNFIFLNYKEKFFQFNF